jgi:hypothetical protein
VLNIISPASKSRQPAISSGPCSSMMSSRQNIFTTAQ